MKNSNVNINLYKTFLEVYELKNISKTAKKNVHIPICSFTKY